MKNVIGLLKLSENKLQKYLSKELRSLGYCVKSNADYVYGVKAGSDVLLIAHTDTVNKPPEYVFHDTRKNVLFAPGGLGADDRAGVYAILSIIKTHKCDVLFTSGEESGGIGARAFVKDYPANLGYKMGIQLDRRGRNDAVFYDNDSEKFHEYIYGYGFKEAHGSFSDISIIGPRWEFNTVNLSVGYRNEHTGHEHLYVDELYATIAKVKNMLSNPIPVFEYVEYTSTWAGTSWYRGSGGLLDGGYKYLEADDDVDLGPCALCGMKGDYVVEHDTYNELVVCEDCATDSMHWCIVCMSVVIPELESDIDLAAELVHECMCLECLMEESDAPLPR